MARVHAFFPHRHGCATLLACAVGLSACGGGDPPADGDVPVLRAGPVAATVVSGGEVTFRVQIDGSGLSFQWQFSIDQGASWSDVAGATGAAFVIAAADPTFSGRWYRVRVSGGGRTVTTEPAPLVVACAPLASRRNAQAFYDGCLDVTWLADAGLAAAMPLGVSGIGADGSMSWPTARAWVQALNAAAYLGFSDWRLPVVRPQNGSSFQLDGNELADRTGRMDLGYNISAPGTRYAGSMASELPFLFYNQLGGLAIFSIDGSPRSNVVNGGAPLRNVSQTLRYWTSTPYAANGAYAFDLAHGDQHAYVAGADGWRFGVLALRDGDIGGAP